ncbi:PREDICTED: mas-related G-protein coupled receptor member H-like, partial [Gekko japonicus]|uniref:Mas-related G-protein coupled receptor member H-like n=1 Tax=Gekko japonicus TaxID=146911 RepID=A0ABM1L6F4_GEKJA
MGTVTPTVEQGKNMTLNVSEYSSGYLSPFTVCIQLLYIIFLLFFLCGLVGNVKIIWILGFCIERKPFATYLLNLAVADVGTLLSGLADEMNMALVFFSPVTHGGFDIISPLADVLVFFTYNASLYLLTALSLETVLSLLFPVWYRCHRPGRSSAVISFLLWILSGLLSGILLLCHLQGAYCGTIVNLICIVNFLVSTPLMVASSLTVTIAVCGNSRGRRLPRLYVTILTTVLVFIIFDVPLSVVYLFFSSSEDFPLEAMEIIYLVASFIGSLYPLIYNLVGRDRKRQFKESWKVVLRRLFKEEGDAREELGK